MPSGLSRPFSSSVIGTFNSLTPTSEASSPAGDFHTPRWASVRAKMPATRPQGAKSSVWPLCSGFGCRILGKNTAAFLVRGRFSTSVPKLLAAFATESQTYGGSTMSIARRTSQRTAAAAIKPLLMSCLSWYGGMQSRLNMPPRVNNCSSEYNPFFWADPSPVSRKSPSSRPPPSLTDAWAVTSASSTACCCVT